MQPGVAPNAVMDKDDPRDLSPLAKAGVEARQSGRRVEVPSLRSETAEVYVNPDGTKTMDQHAVPVRVRKGTGWVAPDSTLVKLADGTVRAKAAMTPIVLSGGGSGHLLTIGERGQRLSMGWPGKLPAPRLDKSTAVYPEVLPGVDLRIDVGINDFSHLLVVKNRAAALNPALRTLRYPISSDSLKLTVRPDGTTLARDRKGKQVFSAPPPTMWDATKKPFRLGIALAGTAMTLTPDQKMLADPKTKFPVLIDPSIGGGLINWLHVSNIMGNQTAWNYDRLDEGAKVGRVYGDAGKLYRSMFLLRTTSGAQTIAGSQIVGATFRITLNKTPTGSPTPTQLWWLNDLSTSSYVDWNNNESFWRQHLDTVYGEAYPWTEDNQMEFSPASGALRNVLQDVADGRRSTVSFGLRAADENNQSQWKKFHPHTAVISITYNTMPRMPKDLNFTRPRPCGTKTAPTAIANLQPQFSAIANDPDAGDNVTTTLQILNEANAVVHTADVGPTVSGAAFAWPEVPVGKLAKNTLYRYKAFTRDGHATGPSTPDCYFTVDTDRPALPVIQSTDFPNGEPTGLIHTRQAGTVIFKPGNVADTDITEYAYGFQQDKITLRVKAGANGVATIPVTLKTESQPLFVKAIDRAGNWSSNYKSWSLQAIQNPAQPTLVRNDANGDGKADITAVFDHGFGRTAVWNFTSAGSSFHNGYIGWDSGEGGGFNLYRTRPVQGDWNKDGRTDLALFREGAGRQVWLYKLDSEGNRYDAPPAVWTSGPNGWPLSTARTIGGDVDGDGQSDIVVQNAGTQNWSALVFRAANNFATPTTWATAAAGNPWAGSTPLLADIDGDNKDDLLSMRNLTGCRTVVDMYRSTGTGFAAAQTIYDSGAGNYCWEKSKPAVTDVDGDGKDDIVGLYEHSTTGTGQSDAGLTVFRSTGTSLVQSSWWRQAGEPDLSKATLSAGDFDGDGKGDAAILYAGGAAGDRQVYTFRSSGTAFGAKVLAWGGPTGAVTGPKFDIERRTYDLVNRNSGKCLNVQEASTANLARYIQWTCLPVDLNARFHIDPVAGTEQYALKPVHTAVGEGPVKCADMDDWSLSDGGQLLQWPCGDGNGDPTANQQVTLEYVDGASYDTVVQLKLAHSKKCLSIIGGAVTDNAPVQQETCGQGANQQWILRPSFNATQLGENMTARYRTSAATSTTQVLDIENCQTADGANVRMWDDIAGSPCESWKLQSVGDDVYKIVDPNSSKALDIDGCSKLPAGVVTIWTSNESECQLWRIEPSPGGTYSVVQVSSGLSLDVAGCSRLPHPEVITWFYHGGPCQRWSFQKR
ncbi:hypothetical protein GCM10009789_79610 [Kribbella sancticallisti]|uniref:Ricin B lectin domain-containing protein n=1 Tax=Kribbella sancticallisti TaxID=460087 RepID=A0ABP4QN63_9ACTN